jgi:UDP-N-acetylmuramoyl-tripeptide--D-alanyl-D-alanine ligase
MRLSFDTIVSNVDNEIMVWPKNPELIIRSLTMDSRDVSSLSDCAFLAVSGGNLYLSHALAEGAVLLIASQQVADEVVEAVRKKGSGLIRVDDPEKAIAQIAWLWRQSLKATVIGVTGSSGKTSTKELIATVLATGFFTAKSPDNNNNALGLQASILKCSDEADYLVLEMGMDRFGEIAGYCTISQPEMAVITNIGVAHLSSLGSRENIAMAKAELIAALPDNSGVLVINGDDEYCDFLIEYSRARERGIEVITYGLNDGNEVYATNISYDHNAKPTFDIMLNAGLSIEVSMKLIGRHSVINALAAAAVAERSGVSPAEIAIGLAASDQIGGRARLLSARKATVIDDVYNANPDSVWESLQTLAQMDNSRFHIAVLGDMFELGADEQAMHHQIGAAAALSGLDLLLTIGSGGAWIAEGARQWLAENSGTADSMTVEDTNGLKIYHCQNEDEAVGKLIQKLDSAPIILIKASHSMHFERIVDALLEAC